MREDPIAVYHARAICLPGDARALLRLARPRLPGATRRAVVDDGPTVDPIDPIDETMTTGGAVVRAVPGVRPCVIDEVVEPRDAEHGAVTGADPALVVREDRCTVLLVGSRRARRARDSGAIAVVVHVAAV